MALRTIVQDGDPILIDIPNRRLDLLIPQEEIDRRLTLWKPLRKPRTPALDRYSALVSSADQGAILRAPQE